MDLEKHPPQGADAGSDGGGVGEPLVRTPAPQVRAPWWSYGLAAAAPLALLGLFCHWYRCDVPGGMTGPYEYGSFALHSFSGFGPLMLIVQGVHWFGARREWWGVPTTRNWRGNGGADRVTGPVARAVAGVAEGIRPNDPVEKVVVRGAAAIAVALGCFGLLTLAVTRWAVPTRLYSIDPHDPTHMPVHLMFGFWCLLSACLLFLVFGLIGCLPHPLRRPAPAPGTPWSALGHGGTDGTGDEPVSRSR